MENVRPDFPTFPRGGPMSATNYVIHVRATRGCVGTHTILLGFCTPAKFAEIPIHDHKRILQRGHIMPGSEDFAPVHKLAKTNKNN